MKNVFIASLLVIGCIANPIKSQNKAGKTIQQLYLFNECIKKDACKFINENENSKSGAVYFTNKGNVIYHTIDFNGDTVRYYYGTYTNNNSTITIVLKNEFYYKGKWDARWDTAEPDYKKGKSHSIKTYTITIQASCEPNNYLKPYSDSEKKQAAVNYGQEPYGLVYFPYQETANMKFYTWFFKQVPVLANL